MPFFDISQRLRCAALAALGGGALAQTISLWGGDMPIFLLPTTLMCIGGATGAALAGFIMADAFGRKGPRGVFWSVQAWWITTVLGAWFGAAFFAIEANRNLFFVILCALDKAAWPGILTVMEGIAYSPAVAVIWLICGLAMHHGAMAERSPTT